MSDPSIGRAVPFRYFPIRFDRNARVLAPGDGPLRAFLNDPANGPTDLIVIAHGWNNDRAEAENLYRELLGNTAALLTEGKLPGLAGRRFAVLGAVSHTHLHRPTHREGWITGVAR